VVLDRGVVRERGTHQQLMANAGLYAELQRLYRSLLDNEMTELEGAAKA
jgi:ABC-type transport system involved in cytochrome bd biosynthesis fused ATPase/permease subunit